MKCGMCIFEKFMNFKICSLLAEMVAFAPYGVQVLLFELAALCWQSQGRP